MNSFEKLAMANLDAAQAIAANQQHFDDSASELLLRNAAVITDRLQANEFFDLPASAERAALEAAEAANILAPLSNEDLLPLPFEPTLEFHYRTGVWQPLHSFQRKLSISEVDKHGRDEVARYKDAVRLGSAAFSAILLANESNPVIRDTERYFWGNTDAAVGRIRRSSL